MRQLFQMAGVPWYTLILRRLLFGARMLNLQRLAVIALVIFLGWGAKPANAFATIPLTESGKEQDILSNICPAFPAGACPISTATFTSDVETGGSEIPDSLAIVFKSGNQGNVFTVTGESGRILEAGFAPPVGAILREIIFHDFSVTDNTMSDRIVIVPDLTGKVAVVFSSDAEPISEPSALALILGALGIITLARASVDYLLSRASNR